MSTDMTSALTYRKLNTSLPSGSFSVLLDRGFANWPAIRPIRTTGTRAPQIRIRENDSMSPILFDIFSWMILSYRKYRRKKAPTWVHASKLSAQSPA